MMKKGRGRPPVYKTPEALREKVDEYFATAQKPTISGLSLYLGYTNRLTFSRQRTRGPQFADIVAYALLRVERFNETQLYNRDGFRGAAFILKNCFGWSENEDAQHDLPRVNFMIQEPAPAGDRPETKPAAHNISVELLN